MAVLSTRGKGGGGHTMTPTFYTPPIYGVGQGHVYKLFKYVNKFHFSNLCIINISLMDPDSD